MEATITPQQLEAFKARLEEIRRAHAQALAEIVERARAKRLAALKEEIAQS